MEMGRVVVQYGFGINTREELRDTLKIKKTLWMKTSVVSLSIILMGGIDASTKAAKEMIKGDVKTAMNKFNGFKASKSI